MSPEDDFSAISSQIGLSDIKAMASLMGINLEDVDEKELLEEIQRLHDQGLLDDGES